MKSVRKIFAMLIIAVATTSSAYAQSTVKIIAVVNKADWCPTCKENGQRAMGALLENNKGGEILFVTNDLTNATTKKSSAAELQKTGLTKAMKKNTSTGVVYFFNAKSKEPISEIAVAKTNEDIAAVITEAIKTIK